MTEWGMDWQSWTVLVCTIIYGIAKFWEKK